MVAAVRASGSGTLGPLVEADVRAVRGTPRRFAGGGTRPRFSCDLRGGTRWRNRWAAHGLGRWARRAGSSVTVHAGSGMFRVLVGAKRDTVEPTAAGGHRISPTSGPPSTPRQCSSHRRTGPMAGPFGFLGSHRLPVVGRRTARCGPLPSMLGLDGTAPVSRPIPAVRMSGPDENQRALPARRFAMYTEEYAVSAVGGFRGEHRYRQRIRDISSRGGLRTLIAAGVVLQGRVHCRSQAQPIKVEGGVWVRSATTAAAGAAVDRHGPPLSAKHAQVAPRVSLVRS